MTPERWSEIRKVYESAEALAVGERAAYLDVACAEDSDLRDEVESLLGYEKHVGSQFLNEPAVSLVRPGPEEDGVPVRIGQRIGVYQIVDEIGRGGMGEVYRATRADGQYDAQVAIKLVRVGMNTSFILRRFRDERQILASLDHPNIARLLDGGTSDDGVPFLVMELIEGVRIDDYCEQHRLSVSERLELFRQVCSAVQYAHQRLIVHRDLKPSNILVTAEGVPKLLDFGIAKIVDPATESETTLARPMTPEYASPEQIRGDVITTATDVYSLGLVLYRLLTGRSPYGSNAGTPLDWSREITESEPIRPSNLVLRTAGAGVDSSLAKNEVASWREDSTQKLHRRLAGDLDEVVLMTLRKEPERRYGSVQQLSEDIARHLDGLPVAARKGSARYVAGKFLRRHKAAVGATAAVLFVLLGGIVATMRQARIAQRERIRAEKRFDDVREFSNSLIFEIHDALQNLPGATPVRKLLLDRAVQYLDRVAKDAAGSPDLQRELAWGYQRLAVVQGNGTESNLGDENGAVASDRKALALFQAVAAKNTGNQIDQLNVAMMHRILSFSDIGDARGRQELDQAIAITDRLLKAGASDPKIRSERSIEYQNQGLALDAAGNRAAALSSLQEYQRMRVDILKTNPEYHNALISAATSTVMVGYMQARLGLRSEGLNTVDRGIAFYQTALQHSKDDVLAQRYLAVSQMKRGDILLMSGEGEAALKEYQKAKILLQPLADADAENELIQADRIRVDYLLSRVLVVGHRYAEGLPSLKAAAAAYDARQSKGGMNPDSSRSAGELFLSLGEAYAGVGKAPEALQSFQKASGILKVGNSDPPEDDMLCEQATTSVKIGDTLMSMHRAGDAKTAYQEGINLVSPRALPENHNVPALYVLANGYLGLGDALTRMGDRDDERTKPTADACSAYQKSKNAWTLIPNPSAVNPEGFLSRLPSELDSRLARCAASPAN